MAGGGGGSAHAVFQWVSASVLFSDDGCDGGGGVAGGGGDGDAWGQCSVDGGVDHADCAGEGVAVCDSGGGADRGSRRHQRRARIRSFPVGEADEKDDQISLYRGQEKNLFNDEK